MKRLFPIVCLFSCLIAAHSFAGSATWNLNPTSGDWNTAGNWTPATVPNGSADIATFGSSSITSVSVSGPTQVAAINFTAGASAYSIAAPPGFQLNLSGQGVTNSSGITQTFLAINDFMSGNPVFFFTLGATCGSSTAFTVDGGAVYFFNNSSADHAVFSTTGGLVEFLDASSADHGTFTTSGSSFGGATFDGAIYFDGTSTAGNGIFTNNGGTSSLFERGELRFFSNSNAGTATLILNGGTGSGAAGSFASFENSSSAAAATLIANNGSGGGSGGTLLFINDSIGGTSRIGLFGNGNLDISGHQSPGVTVGSIEGDGLVFLGSNTLTLGIDRVSTIFSGVIQDGGVSGGSGGSLTKTGGGRITLSNANTYTGSTTVSHGGLLVRNASGSATGTGPVQINNGLLGGSGIIAGTVTVGTGTGTGAILTPGNKTSLGTLTIQSAVTFHADATYNCTLSSSRSVSNKLIANGVTIDGAAVFSARDRDATALLPGTSFTIIDNTSATPISGRFSNLPDGSSLTIGSNTYQASYSRWQWE
jgi:autotransporter-associated beta strand protein